MQNWFLGHIKLSPRSLKHKFQVFWNKLIITQFLKKIYIWWKWTLKMMKKCNQNFEVFLRKNGKIFKLFQYHRKTRKTCLDSLNRPHLHIFTSKLLKSRFWFSEIFSIFRSVIFDIENHKNCCYVKVNVVVDDPKYVLESFWDA